MLAGISHGNIFGLSLNLFPFKFLVGVVLEIPCEVVSHEVIFFSQMSRGICVRPESCQQQF